MPLQEVVTSYVVQGIPIPARPLHSQSATYCEVIKLQNALFVHGEVILSKRHRYGLEREVRAAQEQLAEVVHAMLLVCKPDVRVVRVVKEDAHLLDTVQLVEHRDAQQPWARGVGSHAHEAVARRIDGLPDLRCVRARDGKLVGVDFECGLSRRKLSPVHERDVFWVVIALES